MVAYTIGRDRLDQRFESECEVKRASDHAPRRGARWQVRLSYDPALHGPRKGEVAGDSVC
jgi:hypothetical protein